MSVLAAERVLHNIIAYSFAWCFLNLVVWLPLAQFVNWMKREYAALWYGWARVCTFVLSLIVVGGASMVATLTLRLPTEQIVWVFRAAWAVSALVVIGVVFRRKPAQPPTVGG